MTTPPTHVLLIGGRALVFGDVNEAHAYLQRNVGSGRSHETSDGITIMTAEGYEAQFGPVTDLVTQTWTETPSRPGTREPGDEPPREPSRARSHTVTGTGKRTKPRPLADDDYRSNDDNR